MSKRYLTEQDLRDAIMGGAILGGGGGGAMSMGLASGLLATAYGRVELVSIDEVADDDLIATCAMVGAPSAAGFYVSGAQSVRAVRNLQNYTQARIRGLISNENGGVASAHGWVPAAVLGIPLVDAPCNGRAHPTGTMGSMGLHALAGYVSVQSFCGGREENGREVEGIVRGNLNEAARLVREASISAGGAVGVVRNLVDGKYLRENAAIGGLTHAMEVGRAWFEGARQSPRKAVEMVCEFLRGDVIASGKATDYTLTMAGGLDVGSVRVEDRKLGFLNEYMFADGADGRRAFTFPDLVVTMDAETGEPVSTAELKEGQEVLVLASGKENLKLGRGMFDRRLLEDVERVTGFELAQYTFGA